MSANRTEFPKRSLSLAQIEMPVLSNKPGSIFRRQLRPICFSFQDIAGGIRRRQSEGSNRWKQNKAIRRFCILVGGKVGLVVAVKRASNGRKESLPLLSQVKSWQLFCLGITGWITLYSAALYETAENPLRAQAFSIDETVMAYLQAGVPAAKYTVGIPVYAVGWTMVLWSLLTSWCC